MCLTARGREADGREEDGRERNVGWGRRGRGDGKEDWQGREKVRNVGLGRRGGEESELRIGREERKGAMSVWEEEGRGKRRIGKEGRKRGMWDWGRRGE